VSLNFDYLVVEEQGVAKKVNVVMANIREKEPSAFPRKVEFYIYRL
jgi:hypothetical protein